MFNNFTPQDWKDVINGIGTWSIGLILIGITFYFVYIDKLSADVISLGAGAVFGYFFKNKKE